MEGFGKRMTVIQALEKIELMLNDNKKRWSWAETQLNSIYYLVEDRNRITEEQIRAVDNIYHSISSPPEVS
jgi:hypothetical protein